MDGSASAVSAGTFAYVANRLSNNVSVINTATNTVFATVSVGSAPFGVAVHPAGTFAYVANYSSNNVSVINTVTNTVIATVPVGTQPQGVSVNPAGTFAYVANGGTANIVSVINTATNAVVANVTAGVSPVAFGNFIGGPTGAPGAPLAIVPTLSEWAMVVMAAVLLIFGVRNLRVRTQRAKGA